MSRRKRNWKSINIIIKNESDFRDDCGELVDCLTFQEEFLKREVGEEQAKAYIAVWGDKPGVWDTQHKEVLLEVGMKGGKNYWAEGDAAYAAYYISNLINPHKYFSKITKILTPYPKEKTFDIINVSAVSKDQAQTAFFESIKKVLSQVTDPITGKNWFEYYCGIDIDKIQKKDEMIFPTGSTSQGGIRFKSYNSSAAAPEGIHMIRFYADELSRASSKKKFENAKMLYALGLKNTAASFPNRIGKVIGWSYPNDTEYDLVHMRVEEHRNKDYVYAVKLPTWDFNPGRTREMFNDEYNTDPDEAARIYECIKPISKLNFYQPYAHKIKEALHYGIKNKVHYKYVPVTREVKTGVKEEFVGIELLNIEGDKRHRCLAYDSSINGDRYVIGMGYIETINPKNVSYFEKDEHKVVVTNKRPIIDVLIVIEPKKKNPADYIGIGDVLSALIKEFPNTQTGNSDFFQNEKLRQELMEQGIDANRYSFSKTQQAFLYTKKRALVWNNIVHICTDEQESHKIEVAGKKMSPPELWAWEGETLVKDNGRVDHPEWGSKDVQDVVAILVNDLLEMEINDSTEFAGEIDSMTEDTIRELCKLYMEKLHAIRQTDTPVDEHMELLSKQLEMNLGEVEKLAELVKESYNFE